MKKKVVALAGVLLAGTIVAMAGCSSSGSGSSGKISGNYKEADDETIVAALSNIDVENAFVDTSAKNWKYGLQFGASVDLTINASGNDGSNGKVAIKGSGDYKVSLQKKTSALSGESMTVAGEGSADGSFNVSGTGMQAVKASLKAKAYNDMENVYASVSGTIPNTSGIGGGTQKINQKVKVSLDGIFDEIGGQLPISYAMNSTEIDFTEVVDNLRAEGYTVYLDQSNGLKIKLSAADQYVEEVTQNIMKQMGNYIDSVEWSGTPVFDIYLAFDKNYKFSKMGFDVSIKTKASGSVGVGASLTMKISASLSTYDGTVSLPSGIANDESYIEIGGGGSSTPDDEYYPW